jgi:hypothetical protein
MNNLKNIISNPYKNGIVINTASHEKEFFPTQLNSRAL